MSQLEEDPEKDRDDSQRGLRKEKVGNKLAFKLLTEDCVLFLLVGF